MSTKFLIVILCAAIGAAVGFIIMKTYRRNLAYAEGVCSLVGELKRNMAYRRDGIASVLSRCNPSSALLKKQIDEYIAYAAAKDGKLAISRGFLPTAMYTAVCELFSALGNADGGVQVSELEQHAATFDERRKTAAVKLEKYGVAAVKLGFLFGLCVGILTL